ncbi:MAG: hypothetical protein EOO53_12905 [Gammaproteobacteria bacterium]|nr:MAG: hypothetical protein EOO53_12905 [Gammaproteobacteria bacterium]
MKTMTIIGRAFIAIAMIVFGVQHFVYLEFVTRAFPVIPLWIPGHIIFVCILGAFLIITGVAVLLQIKARTLSVFLGSTILLTFLLLLLPSLLTNLNNGMVWTNAGKALVLAGANFLVAASFAKDSNNNVINVLEKLIPLGKYFLAGFFILAGILHFIYAPFVAMLIPKWIPAPLFWTYFAGVALIVGAIGMLIPRTQFLAATLSAIMVFILVIILHIPRALADLHQPNETTATFEALAMCGMAILIAVFAKQAKRIS